MLGTFTVWAIISLVIIRWISLATNLWLGAVLFAIFLKGVRVGCLSATFFLLNSNLFEILYDDNNYKYDQSLIRLNNVRGVSTMVTWNVVTFHDPRTFVPNHHETRPKSLKVTFRYRTKKRRTKQDET